MSDKTAYLIQIANLILSIRQKINHATDVSRTGYDSSKELISELTAYINQLQNADAKSLKKITEHFFPTGTFQELANSNGWGDGYLKLADEFDNICRKMNEDPHGPPPEN